MSDLNKLREITGYALERGLTVGEKEGRWTEFYRVFTPYLAHDLLSRLQATEEARDHFKGLADEHALFDAETDLAFKDLDAQIADLTERAKAAEERAEKAVSVGAVIAAGIVMHSHSEDVIAEEILQNIGVTTIAKAREIGVDGYDIRLLRPVFAQIGRRDKSRAALKTEVA